MITATVYSESAFDRAVENLRGVSNEVKKAAIIYESRDWGNDADVHNGILDGAVVHAMERTRLPSAPQARPDPVPGTLARKDRSRRPQEPSTVYAQFALLFWCQMPAAFLVNSSFRSSAGNRRTPSSFIHATQPGRLISRARNRLPDASE